MTRENARSFPRSLPHAAINEAQIERLVRTFYTRIRADERLGPIFVSAIGEDWEPHLSRMIDFWSSLMLTTGRYSGQPLQKHLVLTGVMPEDFQIWLRMFEASAVAVGGEVFAAAFMQKARRVAASFEAAMFFDPAADAPAGSRPAR